jgi:hypothetical protein
MSVAISSGGKLGFRGVSTLLLIPELLNIQGRVRTQLYITLKSVITLYCADLTCQNIFLWEAGGRWVLGVKDKCHL